MSSETIQHHAAMSQAERAAADDVVRGSHAYNLLPRSVVPEIAATTSARMGASDSLGAETADVVDVEMLPAQDQPTVPYAANVTRLHPRGSQTTAAVPALPSYSTGMRTVVPTMNVRALSRGDVTVARGRTTAVSPNLERSRVGHAAMLGSNGGSSDDIESYTPELVEALSDAGEFVLVVDQDLRVLACTSGYLRMIGMQVHQVMGKRLKEYIPSIETSPFYAAFTRCVATQQSSIQIAYSKVLGKHVSMRLHPRRGGGFVVTGSPASALMLSGHEELSRGHVDEITKLGNRHALAHQLAELVTRSQYVCLAIIEWTNHTGVRDRLSPDDAEMLLLNLVARLSTEITKRETLYRIDTSLFAIVMDGYGADFDYGARLRHFVEHMAGEHRRGDTKLPVEVCAAYTEHNAEDWRRMCAERGGVESGSSVSDSMLRQVRLALREARTSQSGAVKPYSQAHQQRIELEGDLLTAIAQDQFVLYAQPKLDLFRNRICGAELLVRWRHPTRGTLPPGVFLESLEELKLMRELDTWVIETCVRHLSDLLKRGCAIPLSINLSVESLGDPQIVEQIQEVLDRYRVPAQLLEIEIPEGALMHDVQTSSRVLGRLKQLGIKLSIDDFGTGYCSFRYLGIFPVDTLKIDRSFVAAMDTSPRDRMLVDTMIKLAHNMNMSVVAEGAETAAHVDLLVRAGCNQLQGYVLAKPLPFEDFVAFTNRPVNVKGLSTVDIST